MRVLQTGDLSKPFQKAAVPAIPAKGPEADKLHKEYAPVLSFAGKLSLVKPSKLKYPFVIDFHKEFKFTLKFKNISKNGRCDTHIVYTYADACTIHTF